MLSSISMGAQTKNKEMKYNKIQVEDCRVFYREAGNPENPTLLLLHGFPSSSHMFRELMPALADDYHLIAPDFPAFGQTESPDREHFTYSFDHLARIVDKFTEAIGLTNSAIFFLCWFGLLVFLVDGVLKFQTLVNYFGSYIFVETALLLVVILPTWAIYRLTKEE